MEKYLIRWTVIGWAIGGIVSIVAVHGSDQKHAEALVGIALAVGLIGTGLGALLRRRTRRW